MEKLFEKDLFFREGGVIKRINTLDILFVEAARDYIRIQAQSKSFTIWGTMKKILSKLPSTKFVQVQRSFIVRIDKITEIENNVLTMGQHKIPVGKNYRKELEKRLHIL